MKALTIAFGFGLILLATACMDREQEARRAGALARDTAAAACRDRLAEERNACAETACAAPCARFADADVFRKACVASCVANAECATDADCGEGLECIAIAPIVRRCGPRRKDAGL